MNRLMALMVVLLIAAAPITRPAFAGAEQDRLAQLRQREDTPAFRRAVVMHQALREAYENWHRLPSCQPLAEVMQGYEEIAEEAASHAPKVAAAALDRMCQIAFELLPAHQALATLEQRDIDSGVRAQMATFGPGPENGTASDERIAVRGLRVGALRDSAIVSVAFQARALTGQTERLALDMRVMNPERNHQTGRFFQVPSGEWQTYRTTLGDMFAAHGVEWAYDYRVLPGRSLVRTTFGTVPAGYDGPVDNSLAFENQFYRWYSVRSAGEK